MLFIVKEVKFRTQHVILDSFAWLETWDDIRNNAFSFLFIAEQVKFRIEHVIFALFTWLGHQEEMIQYLSSCQVTMLQNIYDFRQENPDHEKYSKKNLFSGNCPRLWVHIN